MESILCSHRRSLQSSAVVDRSVLQVVRNTLVLLQDYLIRKRFGKKIEAREFKWESTYLIKGNQI